MCLTERAYSFLSLKSSDHISNTWLQHLNGNEKIKYFSLCHRRQEAVIRQWGWVWCQDATWGPSMLFSLQTDGHTLFVSKDRGLDPVCFLFVISDSEDEEEEGRLLGGAWYDEVLQYYLQPGMQQHLVRKFKIWSFKICDEKWLLTFLFWTTEGASDFSCWLPLHFFKFECYILCSLTNCVTF